MRRPSVRSSLVNTSTTTFSWSFIVLLCLSLRVKLASSSYLRDPLHLEEEASAYGPRDVPFDKIPKLETVAEMANLSRWVYGYRNYKDDNECEDWNRQNYTKDVKCHWYRHDTGLGTQVMIVSSKRKDYLAVVFAGTDDLKTSLVDVDVRKIDFGTGDYDYHAGKSDSANVSRVPVALPQDCEDCKVHAGFNNAVFSNHIFDDIYVRVERLRSKFKRLYTTGHSLGAADSILTALAMTLQYEKHYESPFAFPVTALNFGCPQVGNEEFQHYVNKRYLTHSNGTNHNDYLQIWRFVLGWDLVPRLPEFFHHIGHTVQMHHPECDDNNTYCAYYLSKEGSAATNTEALSDANVVTSTSRRYQVRGYWQHSDDGRFTLPAHFPHWWPHHHHHHDKKKDDSKDDNADKKDDDNDGDDNVTKSAMAYYHHTGNATLRYAGVPSGWSSKPYFWVPGALESHAIWRYANFFNDWLNVSAQTWVSDFVHKDDSDDNSGGGSDRLIDDDTYAEPPDDDAAAIGAPMEKPAVAIKVQEREAAAASGLFERLRKKVVKSSVQA